jgi:hypothetical protein
MTDLQIIEKGNGGDLVIGKSDLRIVEGFTSMPYLALFGGNVEQNTPTERLTSSQYFDFWGNKLFHPTNPNLQFNSNTERTLKEVVLNSQGRLRIEQAVKSDLAFMNDFCNIFVEVNLPMIDKVEIRVRLTEKTNQQVRTFIYIWDGTKKDLTEIIE